MTGFAHADGRERSLDDLLSSLTTENRLAIICILADSCVYSSILIVFILTDRLGIEANEVAHRIRNALDDSCELNNSSTSLHLI